MSWRGRGAKGRVRVSETLLRDVDQAANAQAPKPVEDPWDVVQLAQSRYWDTRRQEATTDAERAEIDFMHAIWRQLYAALRAAAQGSPGLVSVHLDFLVNSLTGQMDRRYAPAAKAPAHDYDMPHLYRPGHATECPPGCPALWPAPTSERLHAALVAEGIPLVETMAEAMRSPGRSRVELPSGRMFDRFGREVTPEPEPEAWAAVAPEPEPDPGSVREKVREAEQATAFREIVEVLTDYRPAAPLLTYESITAIVAELVELAQGAVTPDWAGPLIRAWRTGVLNFDGIDVPTWLGRMVDAAIAEGPLPRLTGTEWDAWQRLARLTNVALERADAYATIAERVDTLVAYQDRDRDYWAKVATVVGTERTDPAYLHDLVATLAASERQHRDASSHRQQLRDHYREALAALVKAVERVSDPDVRVNIAASLGSAQRALEQPPEWDGQQR